MHSHPSVDRLTLLLTVGSIAVLSSCQTLQSPPPGPAEAPPAVGLEPPLSELGQLQVFVTDQTTDGRNIHLRGSIRNPYPDPVDGVRVMFLMVTTPDPGQEPRELDRAQKVLSVRLASGERTILRLDLQSMYAGQAGRTRFALVAFAIKRGDQELPPPPDWKE